MHGVISKEDRSRHETLRSNFFMTEMTEDQREKLAGSFEQRQNPEQDTMNQQAQQQQLQW